MAPQAVSWVPRALAGDAMNARAVLAFLVPAFVWAQALAGEAQRPCRVAVIPFENAGPGDGLDWLGHGLADCIADKLLRVRGILPVQPSQVVRVLRSANVTAVPPTDPTAAARVGRLLGAEKVLVGSFSARKGRVLIKALVVNVSTGRALAYEEDTYPREDLPKAPGRLAEWAAAYLGRSGRLRLDENTRRALRKPETSSEAVWEALAQATTQTEVNQALRPVLDVASQDPRCARVWRVQGDAFCRSDPALAVKLHSRALKLDPGDVAAYWGRAEARIENRQFRLAIADCDRAIKLRPDLPTPYEIRGQAKARKGRPRQAIDDFGVAVALDPRAPSGYSGRANAYAMAGQPKAAIRDAAKAIKLDPTYGPAYTARALAYRALGRYQLALRDLDRRIELDPTNADWRCNRGRLLIEMGQHGRALKDFYKAQELDPDSARGHTRLGVALSELGRHDEAIHTFNDALRVNPNHVMAHIGRGVAWLGKGDHDRAIKDFTSVIRDEPSFGKAYYNRGTVYMKQGDWDLAIRDLTKAIQLDPEFAGAYANRAISYSQRGQHDKAKADARTAAKLGYEKASELTEVIDKSAAEEGR